MSNILSNLNKILLYLHCKQCLEARLKGKILGEGFQRLAVGWTKEGLQVWCTRHDCNILHVDFEGQTHPANTTAKRGKK